MNTQTISDLYELEKIAACFDEDCRSKKPHAFSYISPILFRGHSHASWNLETTLERFGKKNMDINEYIRYLCRVKPGIESYTDRKFSFTGHNESDPSCTFPLSQVSFLAGQYEFMVYLRHHGFPTPLLDWSRSIYVALYFACVDQAHDDDSALYMYIENLGHGKTGWVGAPEIATMGQYVSAHKRHFIQQSEYTACIAKNDGNWHFHPHESAIGASDMHDKLEKIIIPAKLRGNFLRKLDAMNINAFSLFGTEESLMQTLAFRES